MTIKKENKINRGISLIRRSLDSCPRSSGVYIFKNDEDYLYVGKAKNLLNRVRSYLGFNAHSRRIKKMISCATELKFIKTYTESDALLLEDNLIKQHKPTYNVRLVDDKSFPYIFINKTNGWSKIQVVRGKKRKKGFYFGPFSSPSAVRNVMSTIEKGFLLRNCNDNFFNNRQRPCMQYQIKRCTAPCVEYIGNNEYEKLTKDAISFLKGNDKIIKDSLIKNMYKHSNNQNFEEAAKIRDRIESLSKINLKSYSVLNTRLSFDIMCFAHKLELIFVQVFFFRNGKNLGNKEYKIECKNNLETDETIKDFVAKFYLKHTPPSQVIINHELRDLNVIEIAIEKKTKNKTKFKFAKKGQAKDLVILAEQNLETSIKKNSKNIITNQEVKINLKKAFSLKKIPNRIEVYDNSHLGGENPTGAMVVYENGEFKKNSYRKFNIQNKSKTFDDYYMMKQVMMRRFNLEKDKGSWKKKLPDLIIIDGGKGHLNIAREITKKFGSIDLIAIAKGKDRNSGNESFFIKDKLISLEKHNSTLFFLQNLRDEAHRFAITSQRTRRNKNIFKSSFDDVDGIGGKLRKLLLSHFGSLNSIKTAGIKELKKVPGIGSKLANKIYEEFN